MNNPLKTILVAMAVVAMHPLAACLVRSFCPFRARHLVPGILCLCALGAEADGEGLQRLLWQQH